VPLLGKGAPGSSSARSPRLPSCAPPAAKFLTPCDGRQVAPLDKKMALAQMPESPALGGPRRSTRTGAPKDHRGPGQGVVPISGIRPCLA
jgi:hypothetical protein